MEKATLMEIENLRRASVAALRSRYQELFGEPTLSRHRLHLFRRGGCRLWPKEIK